MSMVTAVDSSQSGGIYNSYSTVALEIMAVNGPSPRAQPEDKAVHSHNFLGTIL